jgi:hypothetical protein
MIMYKFLFNCDNCSNGNVTFGKRKGIEREVRKDVFVEIPDDFEFAMCEECGEIYLTTEEALQLDSISDFSERFNSFANEINKLLSPEEVDLFCKIVNYSIKEEVETKRI